MTPRRGCSTPLRFSKTLTIALNREEGARWTTPTQRLDTQLTVGGPLVRKLLLLLLLDLDGCSTSTAAQPRKRFPLSYFCCRLLSSSYTVIWAKELLFAKLFGDKNVSNDLNMHSKEGYSSNDKEDVFCRGREESDEDYSHRIYDHVFGYNIEASLSNKENWKSRMKPIPIFLRDVLPQIATYQNGCSNNMIFCNESAVSSKLSLGLINPWNLAESTKVFLEAMKLFFAERKLEIGNLTFDKDDQLSVEFVTAAANIRAASFGIPLHSLFETKGIAGNIVHAVATTNAIVSGLIVIEAIKILQGNHRHNRMTYCIEHPSRNMLLMPVEPFEPNKSCYVCSDTPLHLEIDTRSLKLKDFVKQIIKKKLGITSPIILNGSTLIFEVGDDLEEDIAANYALNLEKVLVELPAPLTNGTILRVEDFHQELSCNIIINHREKEEFDDEEKKFARTVVSGHATQQNFRVENNNSQKKLNSSHKTQNPSGS